MYFIPMPSTFTDTNRLRYPCSDEEICQFLDSNIKQIAMIEESHRNVKELQQRDLEFIRLIEVMSGIECIDTDKGINYGIDLQSMVFPDTKVSAIKDWLAGHSHVLTTDIITEGRRLIVPSASAERIHRLSQRISARKDYLEHNDSNVSTKHDISEDIKRILQRLDDKFCNADIHSVYTDESERAALKQLRRIIGAEATQEDSATITLDRLSDIHEAIFRVIH